MRKLILASASPRRRELLSQLGVQFEVEAAQGEERIGTTVPEEAVRELAYQKAAEVAMRTDGDIVVGADTVVAADGQILGKPKDEADAARMLRMLQDSDHRVITGVAVFLREQEKWIRFSETTTVHVVPMTEEQIQTYIESREPMDKAGAYGIQGKFAAFVSGIEGDYHNVVGLPIGRLYQELLAAGVDLFHQ